jgi:hypothetical protein
MTFTNLPNELLDIIVEYSLPQSFENLATTCKRVYALCKPFIKHHNELRSRFRNFVYYTHNRDKLVAASDLISLIATDPIIARYIRTANLVEDSKWIMHLRVHTGPDDTPNSVPSIEEGGAIVQLFANSRYLRQAQLDWREYYSTFVEDARKMRYSQHGVVFLLSLLEDTEDLTIPSLWAPNAATNQLLDVLAQEATQFNFPYSGLQSVTSFSGDRSTLGSRNWGLNSSRPFLALPHLKSFYAPESIALGQYPQSLAFEGSPYIADKLEVAYLHGCCIDDVGITDFLKHTPHLKTLSYWHSTKNDEFPDWDICKFINAVAREAGSHLIEFSVLFTGLRDSILPGKVSTREFQKLKKFALPVEVVMCNIKAAGVTGNFAASLQRFFKGSQDPFVRDVIPSSVTHLKLMTEASNPYDVALNTLFRNIQTIRQTQLPDLQEVEINYRQGSNDAYKQKFNWLVKQCGREDVTVHLI